MTKLEPITEWDVWRDDAVSLWRWQAGSGFRLQRRAASRKMKQNSVGRNKIKPDRN